VTAADDRPRPRSALVGVDESLGARLALEEAAARVGPNGRLVIAHAVGLTPPQLLPGPVPGIDLHEIVKGRLRLGQDLVDRLARDIDVTSEARLTDGPPEVALAELAREVDVDEIVVGSRGLGRFVAALGSVSHALLHEADRPIVVVPRTGLAARPQRRPLGHRTVVVGFDGSLSSYAALERAAEDAGEDGLVVAVHAYAPAPDWLGAPDYERVLLAHQDHGRRLLADLPSTVKLGVELETSLLEGAPARALIAAAEARDADEIVLGSRGFSPLRGTLGSVSHAVLHEADRPVVVIPARAVNLEEVDRV
jgi:nucleotide-binding universal stress UspA family protein